MTLKPTVLKDVRKAVNGILKPLGFDRRGNTWNRKVKDFVEVIDLQKSSFSKKVTSNLGVVDPDIRDVVWPDRPTLFFDSPECTVGTRLGMLEYGGRDYWWDYDRPEEIDRLASAVRTYALPWLATLHDRKALIDYMIADNVAKYRKMPEVVYLGVLLHRTGEADRGCQILEEIRSKSISSLWTKTFTMIIENLRCVETLSQKSLSVPEGSGSSAK